MSVLDGGERQDAIIDGDAPGVRLEGETSGLQPLRTRSAGLRTRDRPGPLDLQWKHGASLPSPGQTGRRHTGRRVVIARRRRFVCKEFVNSPRATVPRA